MDTLIQKSLAKLKSKDFILSIYFGKNLAKQYEELAHQFSHHFQAPLLRAHFTFQKKMAITKHFPLPIHEVPDSHQRFMKQAAKDYLVENVFDFTVKVQPFMISRF